jgi:hypothetical protein
LTKGIIWRRPEERSMFLGGMNFYLSLNEEKVGFSILLKRSDKRPWITKWVIPLVYRDP